MTSKQEEIKKIKRIQLGWKLSNKHMCGQPLCSACCCSCPFLPKCYYSWQNGHIRRCIRIDAEPLWCSAVDQSLNKFLKRKRRVDPVPDRSNLDGKVDEWEKKI